MIRSISFLPPKPIQTFLSQGGDQILSDGKVQEAFILWAESHENTINASNGLRQLKTRIYAKLPPADPGTAFLSGFFSSFGKVQQALTQKEDPRKGEFESLLTKWSCGEIEPGNVDFQKLLSRIARSDDYFQPFLLCLKEMASARRTALWEYKLDANTTFIQAIKKSSYDKVSSIAKVISEEKEFTALLPILEHMDTKDVDSYVFRLPPSKYLLAAPLFHKLSNEGIVMRFSNDMFYDRSPLHIPAVLIAFVPRLLGLNPDDLELVLSTTDNMGRTPFHFFKRGADLWKCLPLLGKISVTAMQKLLTDKCHGTTPLDDKDPPSLEDLQILDDAHAKALLSNKTLFNIQETKVIEEDNCGIYFKYKNFRGDHSKSI